MLADEVEPGVYLTEPGPLLIRVLPDCHVDPAHFPSLVAEEIGLQGLLLALILRLLLPVGLHDDPAYLKVSMPLLSQLSLQGSDQIVLSVDPLALLFELPLLATFVFTYFVLVSLDL